MIPPPCSINHRTDRNRVACEWPYAATIWGNGRWAVLVWCGHLTISLHTTKQAAELTKDEIDAGGCGGRCTRRHRVVCLDWQHRKHQARKARRP